MDVEDPATGFVVRQRKLDLPVNSPGPDECRVQTVDPVGCHDDLDVAAGVEPVQLIEELQHGALNFALAAGVGIVSGEKISLMTEVTIDTKFNNSFQSRI